MRKYNTSIMPSLGIIMIIIFLNMFIVSCSKRQGEAHSNSVSSVDIVPAKDIQYPYSIVVTTGFIYDMMTNIVKDKAEVFQIIGAGLDPHSYTSTRTDIVSVYYSDLLVFNGLHLEGGLYTVFNRIKDTRHMYAISDLLEESSVLHMQELEDPHIWMDVEIWKEATIKMGELLSKFDPSHAVFYLENAKAYAKKLAVLHKEISKMFQTISDEKRILITSHDAFGYFGRAYDFTVYGVQGLSTVAESSLKHISNLIDIIIENKVEAIFVETSVSEKYIHAIIEGAESRGHHLANGGSLYADSMGRNDTFEGSYVGMIEHNARIISKALGGTDFYFKSLKDK